MLSVLAMMLLFVIRRSAPRPNVVKLLKLEVIKSDSVWRALVEIFVVESVVAPRPTAATFLTRRVFPVANISAPNPILPTVLRLERIAPPVTSTFDVCTRLAIVTVEAMIDGVES